MVILCLRFPIIGNCLPQQFQLFFIHNIHHWLEYQLKCMYHPFKSIKHLQNVLAYICDPHHIILKGFHKCNTDSSRLFLQRYNHHHYVSKHLPLLINQLSHSKGNITHSKKGVRGSPLFPTLSTKPGDFNPTELFLRSYFLCLMWFQPILFSKKYSFIPSLFPAVLVLTTSHLRPTTL
jgi:hypothetical protein